MNNNQSKHQELVEEVISNFMVRYPWFERRLINMDDDHRTAIGVLLEQNPSIIGHLSVILNKNLCEDGWELKKENKWTLTHSEYLLLGMMAVMGDGDELFITDYKEGSGIIGPDGYEYESTKTTIL